MNHIDEPALIYWSGIFDFENSRGECEECMFSFEQFETLLIKSESRSESEGSAPKEREPL